MTSRAMPVDLVLLMTDQGNDCFFAGAKECGREPGLSVGCEGIRARRESEHSVRVV